MKIVKTAFSGFLLVLLSMVCLQLDAQSVIDPSDPVITYSSSAPPTEPAGGQVGKWVRTRRLSWNTDAWKCYILNGVPFRIKFPQTYNHTANDGKRYPAVVFLHGIGERGNKYDNEWSMANGGVAFNNASNNGSFDGYIIIPQSEGGWGSNHFAVIRALLDYMITNNKLDPFATSVNGLSAGGGACWEMMITYPTYVATCLPMSGVSLAHGSAASIEKYKYTFIWHFQGGKDSNPDPNTTIEVQNAINARGGHFVNTVYPNLGHGTWNTAWAEPDFFPACMRAYSANPWCLFGRTEFCPSDPINVTVGVVAGMDQYEWRRNGSPIVGATSNSINVTSLGVYSCRIRKGTVWSDWSRIPVEIKIKAPTVTPPITTDGLMSAVLPAPDGKTSVTLKLPTGYQSYEWRQNGGSTTLGTTNLLTVSTPGEYVGRVTEQYGCSSSFSTPFAVINANGPNKPSAASNLLASTLSKTSLRLDWIDNPTPQYNETGYEIYMGIQAGGPYTLVGITAANAITHQVTGLSSNTKYYFVLRAINATGASALSNESSAFTQADVQGPTTPANLTLISVNRNGVSLRWDPSTDDIGVTKYDIYIDGQRSYSTTGTDYIINGLNHGQTYRFTVRAKDAAGNLSPNSNQVTAFTTLDGVNYKFYTFEGNWNNLPDFNSLTPVDQGTMPNIAITPRSQNDQFAFLWEGYITIPVSGTYYFRTRSDDGSRLWLGNLNDLASPYNFSSGWIVNNDGLHGGQDATSSARSLTAGVYPIAVAFFEQGGGEEMRVSWRTPQTGTSFQTIPNSAFADNVTQSGTAPVEPSTLTATAASFKRINLTWIDNSNNETGFEVWRSTDPTDGYTPVGTTGPNTTSFADTVGVQANTTYYYKIRSIGQYGESILMPTSGSQARWKFNNDYSDASGNGQGLTPNNTPTFSTDSQEGGYSVDLNGSNEDITINSVSGDFLRGGYSAKSVTFWMKADNTSSNRGIFDLGGSDDGLAMRLNSNTMYAGIASNNTRRSISTSFNNTGWNHIALVYAGTSLRLYINGSQVASNTNLGFSSVGTTSNGSMIGDDNGTNALNTSFSNFDGKFDDFRIYGWALSNSDVSAVMNNTYGTVSATTPNLPAVPSVPGSLLASGVSKTSINVTWNDSNTETKYELYRSTGNTSNYLLVATLPANTVSYSDNGLFPNSIFYYKIRAVNDGGNSNFSNEDSAKTLNSAPVITDLSNRTVRYGVSTVLNVSATDADGDNLTFSLQGAPAFASLAGAGTGAATLTLTPAIADQGQYNGIRIIVNDGNGGADTTQFNITVNDNYDPSINTISNYTVDENQQITIPLSGTDQNAGDILSWSVSNLPNNFTLTPGANGSASLVINPTYAGAGSYTVKVTLTDGNGGSAERTFGLTVNDRDPNTKIYTRVQYANVMGAPWNNLNGVATSNLKDENGTTTTVGMTFSPSWWLPYNAGPTTGNNSGVYPDNVLNDFWYFGYYGGPETASVILSGLNPAGKYNLTFYAGSVFNYVPDNGTTIYTVGSQSVSLYVQNNTQNTVSINSITPQANGTITVNMQKGANTPIGYLNALVITQVYDDGTAPATPKNLTAQAIAGQGVRLNWQDVAYNETGYEVYRSLTPAGPYNLAGTSGPGTSTYLDNTVNGATRYIYRIRAVNGYGQSAYTDTVSVTTLNRIPTLNTLNNVVVNNSQTATVNVTATDDVTDHVTLTASNLPSFVTFTDNGNGTGVFNIVPSAGLLGTYTGVTVKGTDNSGDFVTRSFDIFVVDANMSSTYVNITSDEHNAPKPWNNFVIPFMPYAGVGVSGLLDDRNVNTGISITLTDAWTGVSRYGMRPRNGTAVYPEQVSRASIYITDNSVHRVTVSGLNPALRYNFVFYNSNSTSEGAVTNFAVGTQTISLDGATNLNRTAQLNNLTPAANGTLVINVTRASGAVFGLLSGMIIQSYTPGVVSVFSPSGLRVADNTAGSVKLEWQDRASNETNYEVWRANSSGGAYSLIATLGANVTTYTNTGLANNTTYHYAVRARNGSTNSSYSAPVKAYTYDPRVFVNFNTADKVAGSPWNNLNWVYGIGAEWAGFRNEIGVPTNVGLSQPAKVDGVVNSGVNTGNNSGIYPDNVMAENFGLFPGTPTYVVLKGLNLAKTYDVTLFSSVTGVFGENITAYTINGKTSLLNANQNKGAAVTIYGVIPDDNGEVRIDFISFENATFGLLGAAVVNGHNPVINGPAPPTLNGAQSEQILVGGVSTQEQRQPVSQGATTDVPVLPFSAYPNPFNQYLLVSVPVATNNETVEVMVSDITGRVLYRRKYENLSSGNNLIRLETADTKFVPGVYFLKMYNLTDGSEKTVKLVKR